MYVGYTGDTVTGKGVTIYLQTPQHLSFTYTQSNHVLKAQEDSPQTLSHSPLVTGDHKTYNLQKLMTSFSLSGVTNRIKSIEDNLSNLEVEY